MNLIKILTPSKINLGLQVLNKREDDYHNINTVFVRCGIFDEIHIAYSEKDELICFPALDFPAESNLVFKSLNLFRKEFNIEDKFKITLYKNIPMGAGLGGGSSDAAAVLLALKKLYRIKFNSKLIKMALSLGSDVPYFLKNGVAAAGSRGEILNYFKYDFKFTIMVVYPGIHISTPWAYSSLKRDYRKSDKVNFKQILIDSVNNTSLLRSKLFNDFEIPVFEKYPLISGIKDKMYDSGAVYSQMSGSGSAVFGLFTGKENALKAKANFLDYSCFISE